MMEFDQPNLYSSKSQLKCDLENIQDEIKRLKCQYLNFNPAIVFLYIGPRQSKWENLYLETVGTISETGVYVKKCFLTENMSNQEIINVIQEFNKKPQIYGIAIQLSEYKLNEKIFHYILPQKDVQGYHPKNLKSLDFHIPEILHPSLPSVVIELLQMTGVVLKEARVIIFGYSNISNVLECFLILNESLVTIALDVTEKVLSFVKDADIVIFTTANHFVPHSYFKNGVVIIECCISLKNDKHTFTDIEMLFQQKFHLNYFTSSYVLHALALKLAKNAIISTKALSLIKPWDLKPIPLRLHVKSLSDIEIARLHKPKNITILAEEIGLLSHEFDLYGETKAKISLATLERIKSNSFGKYVVVTGITPTSMGEGKSTTTLGLAQALGAHLKKNVIACVRQPSQGPTFGIKGGAAGGGFSQIIPMEEFNLHLTGDIHAVTAANNLLAAQIDSRIFHEATQSDEALYRRLVPKVNGCQKFTKIQLARLEKLGINKRNPDSLTDEEIKKFVRLDIDPNTITWHRVLDTNDRYLRKIVIGMSPTEKGLTRSTQFDISVASEIMAILALASGYDDLKNRLSKIVIANDIKGNPVTAEDLGVSEALAILLKEAIKPNLMQTLEGTPVFVHAGPFANIAHGNSSVIADKLALHLVGKDGFVITEAGFGADIGFEKFCHIKCRQSGLTPNAVVLVATIRALKMHGNESGNENGAKGLELIRKGYCNLGHHINIIKKFGLPVIVALNRFKYDTDEELELVKSLSLKEGAFACVICNHYSYGGIGAKELGEAVIEATNLQSKLNFLYKLEDSILHKIAIVAQEVYGASSIEVKPSIIDQIDDFNKQGYGNLPICIAKTHLSLSDDPKLKGVPTNFILTITDIKASVGARFLYPLAGSISTMPGLPTRPSFYEMHVEPKSGSIDGLF